MEKFTICPSHIFNNYISRIYTEGKMLPSRLQIALGLPNIFSVYSWALWSFFSQIQRARSMPMLSCGVLLTIEKDQKTMGQFAGLVFRSAGWFLLIGYYSLISRYSIFLTHHQPLQCFDFFFSDKRV